MRLGIYGGSFDPVHYGHLLLAEQCREQCELDEVWLIPAADPPHKPGSSLSSSKHRLEMLELATAGHPQLVVSDMEITRGGVSYTVDTLQRLHDEDPQRELFFLMGADSLAELPTWREPERIAELATIAAVNRGLADPDGLLDHRDRLTPAIVERVQLIEMPGMALSATDIRKRVQSGQSIRFMTPRSVEVYIASHGLYQS